ncbi:MAG: methyltransferase regulatory domain-containing protein, partial [Bryobacteraceae bacterium]
PPIIRERILSIVRANLHPNGAAFISYNAHPGAKLKSALRDMMLYHVGDTADPAIRLRDARTLLNLISNPRPTPDAIDVAMAAQAEDLGTRTDSSLFHDELGAVYQPLYFHEFIAQIQAAGLQYIDDADTFDSQPRNLSAESIAAVRKMCGGDWLKEQQYLDFLRNREFRQSVVCRSGMPLAVPWQPERIAGCYATTMARATPDGAFLLETNAQLRCDARPAAYLRHVIAMWPEALRIVPEDAMLAAELYRIGALEIRAFPGVAGRAGEKPQASPLARYQLQHGQPQVTTLWHEPLQFTNESPIELLSLLDGTNDRTAIAAAMQCSVEALDKELADLSYFGLMLR